MVLCVVGIFFLVDGTTSIIDSIEAGRVVVSGQTQAGWNNVLAIARGALIVPGGLVALVAAILCFARNPAARILAVGPAAASGLAYLMSAAYEMHDLVHGGFRFGIGHFFDNRFTALLVIGLAATLLSFVPTISRSVAARPAPWSHR